MLHCETNTPGPKGNRIVADTVSLVLKPSGGCSILAFGKLPVSASNFLDFTRFGVVKSGGKWGNSINTFSVDEIFKESGISITGKDDELSYPWDVITWAEVHPEQVEIRVLWVGPDFEK
jgi:hypothetical protein